MVALATLPAYRGEPSSPRARRPLAARVAQGAADLGRGFLISGAVTGAMVATAGTLAAGTAPGLLMAAAATAPAWAVPVAAGLAVGAILSGASRLMAAVGSPGGLRRGENRRALGRGLVDDAFLVGGSLAGGLLMARFAARTAPLVTRLLAPAALDGGVGALGGAVSGYADGQRGGSLASRTLGTGLGSALGSLAGQGLGHWLSRAWCATPGPRPTMPRSAAAGGIDLDAPRSAATGAAPFATALPMEDRPGLFEVKLDNGGHAVLTAWMRDRIAERPELFGDARRAVVALQARRSPSGAALQVPSLSGEPFRATYLGRNGSEHAVELVYSPDTAGQLALLLKYSRDTPAFEVDPVARMLAYDDLGRSRLARSMARDGIGFAPVHLAITKHGAEDFRYGLTLMASPGNGYRTEFERLHLDPILFRYGVNDTLDRAARGRFSLRKSRFHLDPLSCYAVERGGRLLLWDTLKPRGGPWTTSLELLGLNTRPSILTHYDPFVSGSGSPHSVPGGGSETRPHGSNHGPAVPSKDGG